MYGEDTLNGKNGRPRRQGAGYFHKDPLSLDKNVADAKLENTSLSTDVFITVFVQSQRPLRRLVVGFANIYGEANALVLAVLT